MMMHENTLPLLFLNQQEKQKEQTQKTQSQLPLVMDIMTKDVANHETEKNRKLLEWELSSLEADDLRSHAWYHGNRVDRAEAERLLRRCVAEELSIREQVDTSLRDGKEDDGDSDELEKDSDQSSEEEITVDDFLDGLVDEHGRIPDPSTATSTAMAPSLLLQQRRRMNGLLPSKKARNPKHKRRHFYCFLVRDSMNIQPPGKYVMSCLRVDKYENELYVSKHGDNPDEIGNEQSHNRSLRQKRICRERRQQRFPVLHFVINEVSFE